jgi:hypothetical protein
MEWWPPARRAYGSERKLEYWELKTDDGLILFSDPCHSAKNRSHSAKPSVPSFQYSIIPSRSKRDLRHSQSSLTWPKGPGFQC